MEETKINFLLPQRYNAENKVYEPEMYANLAQNVYMDAESDETVDMALARVEEDIEALTTQLSNKANKEDVEALAEKGVPGGVATLGADGKVPAEQLPGMGTTDHAELENLDYEHSGHTGFMAQPAGTADQYLDGEGNPATPTDTPAVESKELITAGGAWNVLSNAARIANELIESRTRPIQVLNYLSMSAASSINIPLGRPLTDFEEVHITIGAIKANTSTAFIPELRLNNISGSCYITREQTAVATATITHMSSTGTTFQVLNTDSFNVIECTLRPSKAENFFQHFVNYDLSYKRIVTAGTSTIQIRQGFYNPTTGGVAPENITYLTLSGGTFAAGMEISIWGMLRETSEALDIPFTEMPYVPSWTEFVNDVSNTSLTQALFDIGTAYGRIQRFDASNSFNFVKNRRYKLLGVSGGGGGKGGSITTYGGTDNTFYATVESGGAGSPGLVRTKHLILPVDLPVGIVIGAAGTPGIAATSGKVSAGGNGGSGGITSFGNFLSIPGGLGGSSLYSSGIITANQTVQGSVSKSYKVNPPGQNGVVPWTSYLAEKFGRGGDGGAAQATKSWTIYTGAQDRDNYYTTSATGSAAPSSQLPTVASPTGPTKGIAFIMW